MAFDVPLPLRGLLIGFTIAAAVGPISLLTIRRTIAHGQLYGLVSGLGVATAANRPDASLISATAMPGRESISVTPLLRARRGPS